MSSRLVWCTLGGMNSHLHWNEIHRVVEYEGPIFTLERSRQRSADGRVGEYVLVNSPDWVNVISTVCDNSGCECFLMVRQFRHGSGRTQLEFPGGLVDPDEAAESAALRELTEETGYHVGPAGLQELGRTNPNPAFMCNIVHTFYAPQVHRNGSQSLDANEIVDVHLVPVDDILAERRPEFSGHAIMLAALHWWRLHTGR